MNRRTLLRAAAAAVGGSAATAAGLQVAADTAAGQVEWVGAGTGGGG